MKTALPIVFLVPVFSLVAVVVLPADEDDVATSLRQAKAELTSQNYLLRYIYQPGEVITYEIEHLATVDTTIAGNNQQTKMRSKSTRSLHVKNVNDEGHITFEHIIDDVDMWSEVSGREPVRFNSETDKEPPAEYEHVARTVGVPISTITMNQHGVVVDREDKVVQPNLGLGGFSIPLPEQEIGIGYRWSQPYDVKVRLKDNRVKTIKTRQRFQLEKVETGVATISIKTQVLTPINDPRIKAQLVQRLSEGEIRFDVDAGRLISKRLDWDAAVLGFNGADSNMKYLARSTEQLVKKAKTAQRDSTRDKR
jgi:hypothetical protein